MTCVEAPLVPQFDLLQLAVLAGIAFGMLKAFMHKEDWFYPVIGALIPIAVGAVVKYVLAAFGLPTPLYGVGDGLSLILPSQHDLVRNAALVCAAFEFLRGTSVALAVTLGGLTTAMVAVQIAMIVALVVGAFTGPAGLAAAADVVAKLFGFYLKLHAWHDFIAGVLSIAVSAGAIANIMYHMAEVALWAPWLLSAGVPMLAFSRTRALGGALVAIAAVSMAVSYIAAASALDFLAFAMWGHEVAKHTEQLTKELEESGAGGTPAIATFGGGALWIGYYNNTYYVKSFKEAVEALKKDPDLRDLLPKNADEVIKALEQFVRQTKYTKNGTSPIYAGRVAAVEYGNKNWSLTALYVWLDVDVLGSWQSCENLTPPVVANFLRVAESQMPQKAGDFSLVKRVMHKLCQWYRNYSLISVYQFDWSLNPSTRRLMAQYAYNVTAYVTYSAGRAYAPVGLWGWVDRPRYLGPDGEYCKDVSGKQADCSSLLASRTAGAYKYDAAEAKWVLKRDPTPGNASSHFNFTVTRGGPPYLYQVVPLYEYYEYCKWCAQEINGTCVDWRVSVMRWYEQYRIDKKYYTAEKNYAVFFVEKPWRLRPPYTVENLKVPYLAVNYTVVKWWNHTEWSPPPGGSCVYQWVDWSTYKPYKWVGVERADSPHMRYVYAWAWAGGVELKFNYNRTVLEGLVYQNTTFDLWRDGAVYSAYCTPYVNTLPYRAVNTALLQFAVNNLTEVNKEALFALVATSNATKAAADARRMDEAYQKVVSRLSRENATGAREALALVEASKAIVDLYKEGYRAGLYMPLPNIEPSSYRLHHVRLVCLNFHWNATTLVNGTLTITAGREPWVFSFPFGYSNLTKVLIHGLDQFYRLLFEKGVPPPPARVVHTVTYRMGNKTYEYTVNGTPSFYFRTWWDGSPLSYQPANYTPVSSLPTSVWGVPYFAEWFNVPYNALTAVGRAVAESWTRLIVGGIAALAAFEALGVLFGFPTPGRFLYSVAMDILSQLGYWLGIRLAIRAKLFRRLLRPFRVRIARAAKLIAAKLPRLPAPRLRIGGRVRDLREWLRERVRWRWLEEKIRRLEERMALPGVMTEWGSPVDIRRVKEHVKEVAGRVYHALQAHDVVEFLRRISPRVDAFISHIEAKLAERYPTLYKVYALYKGPYVAHYLLAEPVIRRWEAEGKITRAEADQLRRARQLLWAAAAEAKARAVEAEKGVGAKHLRDVFEHRENVVRKALEQLDLMPHAKTKEELAKHLGAAAAHLQHIDPAGTSRLWTALGIAAEGRPVDFHTTREVVEFLWERRERLDVIVQRAKELIAQHYAHAPLSIKDIAKEEVSRQVARVKPLLEAVAKARRYAATGEGAEEAVKALRSKEVKKAAKAAEVEIGALRKAAEKAAKLEEERKELASKIEELRKRAEAIRAEVDALRHSGPSKELEERQRRLEELYVEIERLQQRVASVEERLVEARRRLSVEAREVLEQAARSYRGVFEGVKHEVDPVYLELRRALVEGRLEEAYRQLREQYEREGRDVRQLDRLYGQLKSLEPELQKAREELRAAVKEHEAAIRAEAYVRAEAASELKQLFEKLPTAAEGDVRKGIEIARQVGLEKTAQFLEEYLRHGQVRERYARAASEAAEALRRLAQAREHVVKEQQAAEEKLRQVTLAEDALRRIGQTTEFEKSAKAAKETGLAKTAQFLERWAELVRQAEERGGLEVVNRLGRALVSGRLAEEASALAAEGKALGEWYGRVLELRSLYEEAVKEAAEAKAEAEAVVRTVTELRALIEKTRAESPADLVGKLSKIDVKELESAVKAARSAGLEAAARYFEELANFVKSAEEKAKALREYLKAEKSLKALEAKASIELYRAEKVAEGLAALLEGREYGRLAYVREALKALDEETRKTLKKPLERLSEARREVELLRYSYTYEVGAPVWRKLRQRGVESLLLRAPLTAYVTATLESSLLRETAEAFRPAFAKYEREAATTIVYMPVGEGDKLGPVVSWERALRGEFRPYIEEIAETKAPTLKQAVKDYYAGRGRQFKELAYLEARAAEAVLDVHASKFFLERYAKEGRQEDLALAIALAYRAAKAYQRYQHSHLGQLADVVAEVRQRLGLTGRDVAALAKAVEQLGGEKALRESLRPKNVEEAVKWLREAWAAVDYRALESKLGLTRTYAIPEPDKALEYTAKALTPSRIAALTEGKVSEEAFSVMRTYSLLREFERFMKEKPREVATKAEPAVVRALDRPLPSLQTSAVDKVAKEAASRLVKEAEALAQQHGLKHPETLAVLEQIRELVKVSPEAFGKLVHAASRAKGPFKEWARKLVAEVRKSWDVYRESWEAPVVQRLEALRRVPAATEAPSPVPREFVALALWAELNQAKELKQVVKEISPAAVEEAALLAEAIRAIQRDLEKLKTVEVEKPVFITFETLEKKTVKGVEKLVIDEVAELSKASRYLQHQDPRVREEAELLLKFARGEITRTQLKEELSKRGGPVTEEGKEAVSVEQRLRDVRADLVSRLANEVAVLKEVGALRREAVGAAFYVAAKAGLGDEKAERELKALAAFNSRAVKYAETLKLLRVLSEGLDKAVYEPELAKKFPELRDVLLERDRA
ncbi:hypothetical protein, partial [Pyrobaculum sp.]|uniref:hypothetical protein n=1 Tax=Pyrobaculum sp. TaxID=2004705 RepID=UPI00315E2BB1